MSDTPYHHGDLRQALLDRAIEVLSTGGAEALSLRALARDLGVSHAAPTRHFPGKADLLEAVAEEGVRRLLDEADAAAGPPDRPGRERLFDMALAYVDWARRNPAFHHVLRNPDVLRHGSSGLSDRLRDFAARQRAAILRAQAEGWRSDADPGVLLLHLMSLTSGMANLVTDPAYRERAGVRASADQIQAALRLFLGEAAG